MYARRYDTVKVFSYLTLVRTPTSPLFQLVNSFNVKTAPSEVIVSSVINVEGTKLNDAESKNPLIAFEITYSYLVSTLSG